MLEIGSIVDGKYKILNKIGQGGMSVVYLAMNERANKQWAIKEVRKDGVSNFEVVKQGLIAETDMLKKLNHPHLPSIIDVIDGEGTFLIVMDYIEGKSLSHVLKNHGAQSQEDVIEWAKQLCDVLGYLHTREKPIVYRDMKPANVMLKPDGNVTLIDFGTAREFKSASIADTTCLGTQGYAAPEQFGGMGQTDARTDIYCLGATMYHLVTGHNPAEPPYEMYPIRQWNPALSSGLEEIIFKCTQRNPADRYQSCAELMYALEHYRDLENESKREYSKKWKAFLGSAIMTGVCLVATIGLGIGYSGKKSSTYDSYMENARNSKNESDYSTATEYYEKAIELAPEKGDAYMELLSDVYLKDGQILSEESSSMKQIFTDANLKKLKEEDPSSYYQLMYKIGNGYFFMYYNEEIGRTGAGKYYSIATEGDKYLASDTDKKRARALAAICNDYDELGAEQFNDGSTPVDYEEIWNALGTLVEGEYNPQNDTILAIKVYETYYQYITKYSYNFHTGGNISYAKMIDELEFAKEKIKGIQTYVDSSGQKLPAYIDLDNDIRMIDYYIEQLSGINGQSNISTSKENTKK